VQPNAHNPLPVVVPPPIQSLASHNIRHRVVLSVIGLPLRGQAHIARRLRHYLDFFHGAHTSLFDLNDFTGLDNADEAILNALKNHFEVESRGKRHAILYTTNSLTAADLQWSGHSKSRRRWMNNVLLKELGAELHVVELQVNGDMDHNMQYIARHRLTQVFENAEILQNHIEKYSQRFVTLQGDGSEDYLHYVKVMNYNKKVTTCNMMNTFIGSRVARFMANVHPYKHVFYMTRVGESEFHVSNRIGGDAPLSAKGDQFALRLAEFANFEVDKQHSGFTCVSIPADQVSKLESCLTNFSTRRPPSRQSSSSSRNGNGHNSQGQGQGGGSVYHHRDRDRAEAEASSGEEEEGDEEDPTGEEDSCSGERGCIVSCGDWTSFKNGSKVREGMCLRRLQVGLEASFQDAPSTKEEVLEAIGSGKPVTMILTDLENDWEEHEQVCARLWTSALLRARQTVKYIDHPIVRTEGKKVWKQLAHREYRNLNEQYAGQYEGLTHAEVAEKQPHEMELRALDKLGYRYPRGESLLDVIARLEDMIQHLESYTEPLLIVAHLPILRFLYAYVHGIPREEAPDLDMPSHEVIKVVFDGASGIREERYWLGP